MSTGSLSGAGASPLGAAGAPDTIGGTTSLQAVEAIVADPAAYQTLLRHLQDNLDLSAIFQAQEPALAAETVVVAPGDLIYSAAATRLGALLCDGSAVSRTIYAALFAALGGSSSPYGSGDGSTTFNVPDCAGRVLMAAGSGAGLTTRARADMNGQENHLLSTSEMPSHTHTDAGHQHTYFNPTQVTGSSIAAGSNYAGGNPTTDTGYADISYTGGGGSHNNLQPFTVVNVFIKT